MLDEATGPRHQLLVFIVRTEADNLGRIETERLAETHALAAGDLAAGRGHCAHPAGAGDERGRLGEIGSRAALLLAGIVYVFGCWKCAMPCAS